MAEKRKDNTEWRQSMPKSGSSTKQWKNWATSNPNRVVQAKKAEAATNPNKPAFEHTTTSSTANTKQRKAEVAKWKAARPVSGKGKSKSDAEKAQRRSKMVKWADYNPNKRSNALRTIKQSRGK